MNLIQELYAVNDYLDQGGTALYVIFVLALIIWVLMIERFFYIAYFYRKEEKLLMEKWLFFEKHEDAGRIREAFKSILDRKLFKGFEIINMLITTAPLFGLYGTVYGMIEIFDVIAQNGTGDARAMAGGISMATLSTMSGMAVAITGLFFHHRIKAAADRAVAAFNEKLKIT